MNNAEVVRAFFDACNSNDVEATVSLVDADYALNDRALGRDELKSFFAHIKSRFPDDQMTIKDLIAERDQVVVRLIATGTHDGPHRLSAPHQRTGRSPRAGSTSSGLTADSSLKRGTCGTLLASSFNWGSSSDRLGRA